MAARRRPATRRTESVEPVSAPAARQTRSSTRRPETSTELESLPQAEKLRRGTQRGTRRGPRRSSEDVAIDDFTKNNNGHVSPQPEKLGLDPAPGSAGPQSRAVSEVDDAHESPEMDAARVQDMLDFDIPKLTRWSGKMYDILSSTSNRQPTVDDQSRLSRTRKSFNHARLPFTDNHHNGTLFLGPINLSGDYDPGVRSIIQTAVCSGNIMSLLASIIDIELGKKESLPILEQIDHTFPASFDPRFRPGHNDTEKVLDLAFRIRYRYLIESLASNSSVEPHVLAANIFCNQPPPHSVNAREALEQGPYRQLAGSDTDEGFVYYQIKRSRIQNLVSNSSSPEILSSLDQDCPQPELFNILRSWALEVYQQLRAPSNQVNIQTISPAPRPHARIERGESEPLFVDNNDEVGEDSDSSSGTDAEGYDQLPPQESNQSFIDSSATLAAVRQSEKKTITPSAITPPSNQQAAKREDKVLDTSDAIRRLEPMQILNRTRKRPNPEGNEIHEDHVDDDDFEVNEQLLDESRRTRNDTATIRRPPFKRPRLSQQPQRDSSPLPSHSIANSQAANNEQLLDDLPGDTNLQEQDIIVLSQSARNIRRANYSDKPRQIRVPWSASDTARLLDLIADPSLNCSWSAMEKTGGFETVRNQQSLRDKARGLKVWYLEGDRILPAGFDRIALGQKEKDAVIKCGRNPDRREDDLDDDGQVTNNVWVD